MRIKGDVKVADRNGRMRAIEAVDNPNDGYFIAVFHGPDAEANAEYARQAWNRHDDLVRLLTEMLFNHGPRNAEEARIDTATRALLAEIEKERR